MSVSVLCSFRRARLGTLYKLTVEATIHEIPSERQEQRQERRRQPSIWTLDRMDGTGEGDVG